MLAILVAAAPAHANPLDVFGLTSRRAGQANTGVAAADDVSALYYDPAGLVASRGGELALGTLGAYSHLGVNGERARLLDGYGFQLAMRATLGGVLEDRIAVGLGLHVAPSDVARIVAPASDAAFYPQYRDRLSRMVVLPGAAVRLGDGISLGAAVNLLAGVGGSVDASGATGASVNGRAPIVARAIAGMQWQLSNSVRLGAVYRQRFEVPFATKAKTIVDGVPVDLDVRASGHFTPHQVGVGIAWTSEALAATLDLGWAKWSGYPGPYVGVDGPDPAPVEPPNVPFEDAYSLRTGLESVTDAGLVYRGGYGFETSPVPRDQTGVTNLLDGNKHIVAFGGGYVWKSLRIDAHVQVQVVSTRRSTKTVFDGTGTYDPYTSVVDEDEDLAGTQSSNPGYPSIKSGGEVFSAGLTLEVPL